ncbi:MAG TPA: ABC transporter ATP-binding protein [Candidatus Acidoferrum sp.]|nr:ABC transporter ATP-binding protein [Candidatus Acidoferrum sp.]
MSDLFRLEGVGKKFDGFELRDITMSLPGGMIMGLVGANGSGKTTTIKLMLNMLRRDSGSIEIFGLDNIKEEQQIKREVGVVMDGAFFYEVLRPAQIERVLERMYDSWDKALYASLLKRFGVSTDKKIKEMSRGTRTKLSIVAALARRPKLLLLDEATSGLDPIVRDEILDFLLDFVRDEGCGVLLSSHITSDLDKAADIITMVGDGKLLLSEGKDDLLDRHALWKGTESELAALDPAHIVGSRKGSYGCEALLLRGGTAPAAQSQKPTVEDIMLYYTRRDAK